VYTSLFNKIKSTNINDYCGNASLVFGFRELNKEIDTKAHLKYLVDPDVSWRWIGLISTIIFTA
jgi:L-rhamnose mutarotase